MIYRNKRLLLIASIATVLLAAPLVAMQFTNDVNSTPGDFIAAAICFLVQAYV